MCFAPIDFSHEHHIDRRQESLVFSNIVQSQIATIPALRVRTQLLTAAISVLSVDMPAPSGQPWPFILLAQSNLLKVGA